ncbi:MAG: sulfite exporter TauE/SafE family protein [Nitrospirae bacterium]|nr:MAG: sulfite exporter TauE/SafE family protein [Nitrospirota bacterium]
MEFLKLNLSISGVETYIFIPPLFSFLISYFSSMAGLSGAFILLPFQMSVLNFTSPSVSATNFLYNVVGIPGGIYRYMREGRMFWLLALIFVIGVLPGLLIGYYIRIKYLFDPALFKFFVGIVLIFIAIRLFKSAKHTKIKNIKGRDYKIENVKYISMGIEYYFMGERVFFKLPHMLVFTFFVGIISGIYGIGGGAIIVPVCVSVFKLPVYTIAGAALLSTFATSIAGVLFYTFIPIYHGMTAPPDWILGLLFGIGGIPGMYLGAKTQKHVPENIIKVALSLVLIGISCKYILNFLITWQR